MTQRLLFAAATLALLACSPSLLVAEDAASPFAQEAKRPRDLHDLIAPEAREKKAMIPSRAKQKESLDLVGDALGSADTRKRRAELARSLIKVGREDKNPANRYVALRFAGELAVENADVAVAGEAADSLGEYFDVDALAIKASIIERLYGKIAHRELITVASRYFEAAMAANHFEAAARVGRVGYRAAVAAKDKKQIAEMRRSAARIKDRKATFEALKPAISAFKEDSSDVSANLRIGEYLCYRCNNWKLGVPLLVKGGHSIAKQEMATADDPVAQRKVADAWWKFAQSQTKESQKYVKHRAAMWYKRALPELKGLTKLKVERRLKVFLPSADVVASNETKPKKSATRKKRSRKNAASRSFYLDDVKEIEFVVGYGSLGKHGSQGYNSEDVVFQGQTPQHALSTHGKAKGSAFVSYALAGKFRKFKATIGVVDIGGGQPGSPLTFIVIGDGKALWRSKPVERRTVPQLCEVDVKGVRVLRLQVDCPGSNNQARAVWLNPQVWQK